MEKSIDRLIDSVGVATFIKYFKQFSDLHKEKTTKSKIAELFGENSENWSEGSKTTKINAGLKIFTLNRELEAIEHILYVKKTGNIPNGIEIKKQAERIQKSLVESWFSNPEEISQTESEKHLTEGKSKTVYVNIYERNIQARKECIEHFGLNCQVCEYSFEDKFGDLGKDYIHVHHKIEIATIGKEYKINPITDLIPVCPNCHSMLHRRKPAYSVSELKQLMK